MSFNVVDGDDDDDDGGGGDDHGDGDGDVDGDDDDDDDDDDAASILCEPAQSKRTWTCHKGHFCRNLQGKCRTRIPRPVFCASLRSRNAHGHVTRVSSWRNLQGKCRTLPIPPRLNTGP